MLTSLGFQSVNFVLNGSLQVGTVGVQAASQAGTTALEGLLHGILVNNDSTSQLINIRDGGSTSTIVAQHRTQAGVAYFLTLDVQLQNGLFIATSGGTTPNLWLIYK